MAVEKVLATRYRAGDGTLFDDYAAASRYDKVVSLRALFDRQGAYGEIPVADAVGLIIEKAQEIIEIPGTRQTELESKPIEAAER